MTDYGDPYSSSYEYNFTIFVNGTEIFMGNNYRYESSGSTSNKMEEGPNDTSLMNHRFYFPEGTQIQLGQHINLLNIVEFEDSIVKSKLVTSTSTVPSGKYWKLTGYLNQTPLSQPLGRSDHTWSVLINGKEYHLETMRKREGISSEQYSVGFLKRYTKFYYTNELILPPGTSIAPNENIYGLTIIEFNLTP